MFDSIEDTRARLAGHDYLADAGLYTSIPSEAAHG